MDAPLPTNPAIQQHLLLCATTEEYTLQAARTATITDSSTRANMFLMSVTGALIALGFIVQAIRLGPAFYTIASLLFGCQALVGLMTFVRVVENGIEDSICARGLNRLRHLYIEMAPALAPYLILGTTDDPSGHDRTIPVIAPHMQVLFTTASTVALVTAVCAGATVGLIVRASSAATLAVGAVCGVAVGAIVFAVLLRLEIRAWTAGVWRIPVAFHGERRSNPRAE